ncbi:MAG: hypothetical protein K2W96_01050 [Gemmataceae bacterium]|nr:hypothetical protein [Gemmataceae bacterium]
MLLLLLLAQPAPLSLDDAVRSALDERPKVKAARLMVVQREAQASEAARLAHLLHLVRRDLPVRREQATLGLAIAQASLEAQEADVRYAVSRTFVSLLFARAARRIAKQVEERVGQYQAALALVKPPLPALLDPFVKEAAGVPATQAEGRVIEAEKAVALAMAALKQAMGREASATLVIRSRVLPRLSPEVPSSEETIRLAKERSTDLRRLALLERIHALEADAQERIPLPRSTDTFAAGGDLHSTSTPPEGMDEYRPAPIVPEMPVKLSGSKSARVQAARLYAAKATEVRIGAERLIELRATAAWETIREKRRKLEAVEKRVGDRAERAEKALAAPPGAGRAALLQEGILALLALADVEAARFEHLIALMDLERLTAGAFRAGLEEAIQADPGKDE